MILSSKVLDLLLNSKLIKEKYPFIDKIKSNVKWDGDEDMPWYEVVINFYLNIEDNPLLSWFDPHEFIYDEMNLLLGMVGVSPRDISQIYVRVWNNKGEVIY